MLATYSILEKTLSGYTGVSPSLELFSQYINVFSSTSDNIICKDIIKLMDNLLHINKIQKVSLISIDPSPSLTIIANDNYLNIFDEIADIVLDFELEKNISVSYICGNESESQRLITNEIYSVS